MVFYKQTGYGFKEDDWKCLHDTNQNVKNGDLRGYLGTILEGTLG